MGRPKKTEYPYKYYRRLIKENGTIRLNKEIWEANKFLNFKGVEVLLRTDFTGMIAEAKIEMDSDEWFKIWPVNTINK